MNLAFVVLSLAILIAFGLVGLFRLIRSRVALLRRRRTADALLRTGVKVHPHSGLLTWRSAELTSERNRKMLSHSLDGIVAELEAPPHVSPVPLNRRAVRPYAPLIRELAARVAQLDRPVRALGLVLVEEQNRGGGSSPLYLGGYPEELPAVIDRCLDALDDERVAGRRELVAEPLAQPLYIQAGSEGSR